MRFTFIFWTSLLVFAFNLLADRVETKDGSIFYGKILEVVDGNLTFETTYSNAINIPLTAILSMSSSSSITVRDEDNQTLSGQSIPLPVEQLNLRDSNQSQNLSFEKIQHLWPASGEDPLIIEEKEYNEGLLMKWKNSLGFDLVGSSGNTDSLGAGFRMDSIYSNNFRELDLFLSYNTQTTNGVNDTDETKGGAEYDSIFHEQLAWYLRSDFEHDTVEQINLRITTALGLKYRWIEKENYQVSTRFGGALRYEDSTNKTIASKKDPALDLGIEYLHEFNQFMSLQSELSFLPRADDLTDYLLSHDSVLVFPISEDKDFSIRSGLSGTYDSIPNEELEKMDMKYYLRVVYDFQ